MALPDHRVEGCVEHGTRIVAEHALRDQVVSHQIGNAVGLVPCGLHDRMDIVSEVDEEAVRRSSVDQLNHLLPRGCASLQVLYVHYRDAWHRLFVGALELADAGHGYGQTANRIGGLTRSCGGHCPSTPATAAPSALVFARSATEIGAAGWSGQAPWTGTMFGRPFMCHPFLSSSRGKTDSYRERPRSSSLDRGGF